MSRTRNLGLLAIALGCMFASLLLKRRAVIARKLADVRRFVSHRIVDEDARACHRAGETWDDDGGAGAGAPAPARR